MNPYEQWMVNNQLDGMTRQKDPATVYPNTVCTDCGIEVHLFGIRDGIGNDILEIEVYLDYERKIMYPLAVYSV